MIIRCRLVLSLLLLFGTSLRGEEFAAADLEFFEKQVRPLLAEHCYECHSAKSKSLRGGLRVDSRQLLLAGGDTGPAIEPGEPDESLLIDAVQYGDLYQMPPKYKLKAPQVEVLRQWVSRGAPWPDEQAAAAAGHEQFDLQQRRQGHWAWRPVADPDPPPVRDPHWPADPLDRFVLAGLEAAGLAPAPEADPRQLVRRVHFDLTGLPPDPEVVERFAADPGAEAWAELVDDLLDSPQFGERWARHWLDLVRYAESRGHEFDYDAANAWRYRDYVIRALNANVPYDQLLREHLAGDLLQQPRRHPVQGFNESVLGTGFWFLGEWVHSPVDIRQDETDRMDNAIDVFSKTFLGMTVACARCHDHKFDAISQRDYYALAGFLQSSAYRQVRYETLEHNRKVAARLQQLGRRAGVDLARIAAKGAVDSGQSAAQLLPAAVAALQKGVRLSGPPPAAGAGGGEDIVFEDFEDGDYDGWTVEGTAFGETPVTLEQIADYQGRINAVGKCFVNSHNIRPSAGERRGDPPQGTLTSRSFTIERDAIEFWVGGGAHDGSTQVQLLVDGKVVRKATGRNNNQMSLHRWDVAELRGSSAQFQVVDRHSGGWGNIGLDHIVLTNRTPDGQAPPAAAKDPSDEERLAIAKLAAERDVSAAALTRWIALLLDAQTQPEHPLHELALAASGPWQPRRQRLMQLADSGLRIPDNARVVADFGDLQQPWLVDGPAYGQGPVLAGQLLPGQSARRPLAAPPAWGHAELLPAFAALKARDSQREPGQLGKWDRAGKTLRTPTFELTAGRLYYLIRGGAWVQAVVDSHRTINGPLHGAIVKNYPAADGWRWVEHRLEDYRGHRLHVEFSARDEAPLQVALVVAADSPPPAPEAPQRAAVARLLHGAETADEAAELAGAAIDAAVRRLSADLAGGGQDQATAAADDLAWIQLATARLGLWSDDVSARLQLRWQQYDEARRELRELVRLESAVAPAMWDGSADNEFLLTRGNAKNPAEQVPRRQLEALGGEPMRAAGSGRLELARQLLDEQNPLVSRVMVNRIWHHLTGRGIVPTVDNFGVLGQPPSHPQLLDHLAARFRREGWDIKGMIRAMVLSRTYRMSSVGDPRALQADPANQLLHHMPARRLQGEAIRDTLLKLSGRLDLKQFGPSVPVHLTEFMQGRGRPGQGPLDGAGRRSIYISVRRNFLSPMMLAFDTPQPTTTIGRRNVSNVPAQALILLNDPFVVAQARGWAERLAAAEPADIGGRIALLYAEGLARPPSDEERQAAERFLAEQAEHRGLKGDGRLLHVDVWADLCHVMFNVKEFIYVP